MDSPAKAVIGSSDWRWAAGVSLVLAGLYWHGHCRSFGPGDSPQHVLSAITWGVSRPPGYPLYVMLGRLASILPVGTPAGNVNALSGLLHALAAAAFFLALRRWRCGLPAALTATALMSLSPLYWYYSEVAEVRALNDLLAVGAVCLCAHWSRTRGSLARTALGLCLGLGIGHHPTFLLTLPAIVFLLYGERLKPRDWVRLSAWALIGAILPYLLLGLRLKLGVPAYNPDDVSGWSGLLDLWLRRRTGGFLRMSIVSTVPGWSTFDAAPFLRDLGWFARLVWTDLLPPGILLALLGAWRLFRRDRRLLVFGGLWLAATGVLFIVLSSQQLRLGDLQYTRAIMLRFYLLPMIGLFALAGFGAQALFERSRPGLAWLLLGAALSAAVVRPIDLSRRDPLLSYARDILRSSGPRDMVLLESDDAVFALAYLDLVERRTGERVFLVPSMFSYPPYGRNLQRRHPGLHIPSVGGEELSRRLSDWTKANPGRGLFGEPPMRGKLLRLSKDCAPSGVLIQVGRKADAAEISEAAERFLAETSAASVADWDLRPFTQEIYVAKAYAEMLEYYVSLIKRPEDAELSRRLWSVLAAIAPSGVPR